MQCDLFNQAIFLALVQARPVSHGKIPLQVFQRLYAIHPKMSKRRQKYDAMVNL